MKRGWKTATLRSVMHDAIIQQGLESGIREQRIISDWESIVGIAIARQSIPQRLRNGILWVAVRDAAWRQELSLMRRELVAKINAAVDGDVVKEIRLR
ncbi:MAG: DUF721 domain-containing protein [Bacteroidota bacterium]|nr:DUF721 domain-containing protein [Bacteroidota bacterium]